MKDLQYPIGEFHSPPSFVEGDIENWIQAIADHPSKLASVVLKLGETQLDTPYRDGGWTVRQVVHHLADSHLNSYIRFKWTLTEDHPTIKAYNEKKWAELEDGRTAPVQLSLNILAALHARWVAVLRNFTDEDWKKKFHHPESGKDIALFQALAMYAWHGNHHLAHITSLCKRMNWTL